MGYILYEAIKGIRGHKLGKSKLSVLCSKVQGFPREKKKTDASFESAYKLPVYHYFPFPVSQSIKYNALKLEFLIAICPNSNIFKKIMAVNLLHTENEQSGEEKRKS